MRLAEVVLDYPSVIGLVDATKLGMRDILFALGHPPTLWHAAFPPEIQERLISFNNPSGDLTNSDLEQAGILAQADVAASLYDLWKLTLLTLNTIALPSPKIGRVPSPQIKWLPTFATYPAFTAGTTDTTMKSPISKALPMKWPTSFPTIMICLTRKSSHFSTLISNRTHPGACAHCCP